MDQDTPHTAPLPLDPDDYYFEGSNLVFTAAYHLKRGTCCGSGCRHCPYRGAASSARPAPATEPAEDDGSPAD